MKKYKKIVYILLLIIIVGLSFTVYATVSKDNIKIEKEKKISEFEFLESKLESIFNQLNNIEIKNYNISTDNITKKSNKQEESSNSNQGMQSEGSNNNQEQQTEIGGNTSNKNFISSSDNSSESSDISQKEKEFNIKNKGVLTSKDQINWDNIKSEIEILYSSIPTITLDFYQSNVNQEDILNFNKEFDNLTSSIKDENKEDSLVQLSKLYNYMPKFAQNLLEEDINKTVIETKNNILKAYSKLDKRNWKEIAVDIKQASNVFSKLLTNTITDQTKQYKISKIYIMINELQNAVQLEDETVFLIKYKNVIEEISNI